MNQPIFLSSNIDIKEWKSILKNSHFTSPFQTPKFLKALKATEGVNGEVYALAANGIIKILAVVTFMKEPGVKGFFSRRGVIFGGPLIHDANKDELKLFLNKLTEQLKNKIIYLETRNFFNYFEFKEAFTESKWHYEPYLNIQLLLKNVNKTNIHSLFKYNRRRECKLSIENGASYYISNNSEDVVNIYKILKKLYKERVKLPLPSLDYFLSLFNNDIIKVFIVKHNDRTIGGAFCPVLQKKAIYTYYYCGLRDYNKKIFPTHLAVLGAIEYAIDNNIPVVDFMGAGKTGKDYGVRKYKQEFGGDLVEYGRHIKVLNPFLFNLGKLGLKISTNYL